MGFGGSIPCAQVDIQHSILFAVNSASTSKFLSLQTHGAQKFIEKHPREVNNPSSYFLVIKIHSNEWFGEPDLIFPYLSLPDKHIAQYLMDNIGNPPSNPKRAIFGSNKHEGSFVLGSKRHFWKSN